MSAAAAPERSGLSIVWDVVVAPKTAFEALRSRPQWLWAFGVTCALGIAGAALQIPAGEHIAAATVARQAATDANMADMSPAKLEQVTQFAVTVQHWIWPFYPLIVLVGVTIASVVMLVGNAIARAKTNFARTFALAANVAVLYYGIGYLIIGILCTLRGPQDFSSQTDIIKLMPSLAWLAPGAPPRAVALLGAFNPFQIWSFVLLALGMNTLAEIPLPAAYLVAAIATFGGVVFALPFVR